MMPLTVGSLFSGIGGFELGLERTGGFKTVWQCEIDPFCQKVLEKHWPNVKRFTDIKKIGIEEEIPHVNVICGGFPCQPVSCAGKRRGKEDERWLWPEFYRVIRCVQPEWVLIENVPGLLSADAGRLFAGILRDLSESGYDAEWNIVSAASVGAPHLRKRVFVVAHSTSQQNDSQHIEPGRFGEQFGRALEGGREALRQENGQAGYNMLGGCCEDVAHTSQPGRQQITRSTHGNEAEDERRTTKENNKLECDGESGRTGYMADTIGLGRYGRAGVFWQGRRSESEDCCAEFPDTSSEGLPQPEQEWEHGGSAAQCSRRIFERRLGGTSDGLSSGLDGPWGEGWEDGVPRVVTGQKDRVDRLKALGNAIVPQCAQFVGQCLLDSIKAEAAQ